MISNNHKIKSEYLGTDIQISSYGHYGLNLLLFRNQYYNEENGISLIQSLEHQLNIGKIKLFCVNIFDTQSWLNYSIEPYQRSQKHFDFNNFIIQEVVPIIYKESGGAVPIITCGASNGAFHAANTFFRRPDIFLGTIALSGFYDIRHLSGEYFDDNCYFNSPCDYLPNLQDNYWLTYLMSRKHIYLASGNGTNEHPEFTKRLSEILYNKNITHNCEIWGNEWDHSVPTWIRMFKHFLENYL